jgi:hypothetical protein
MLEAILSNPGVIIGGIVTVLAIAALVWYSGTSGLFIIAALSKTIGAYAYKALYPAIIVLRQKSPYKLLAVFLAFSNFFVYFYTFVKTGNTSLFRSALNALGATLIGAFNQVTTGGWVLLQNIGDPIKMILATIMMILGFATISLWFIGIKMVKKRMPELTYYVLVFALLFALSWGADGLNSIFEVTDLVKTTAETVQNNGTVNASAAAPENATIENFSLFSD